MFVGAAITIAMWQANGDKSFWWGLVIIAWGLGRLASEYLEESATPPPPQAGNGGPAPPGSTFNR